MSAPAAAEALLRGFIADPGLEEAVLGDLVEEWGDRAAGHGVDAADGWYRSQALRTAPHLLMARWRGADPRELRTTLGRASLALVAALLLAALTLAAMPSVSVGPTGLSAPASSRHAIALAALLVGGGWALLAGSVLAHRTRRAPMAAAALLGLGWIPATAVPAAAFPGPAGAPLWLLLAFPATLALATALGGAAATLLRRPDGAKTSSTHHSTSLETAMMTKTENDTPFRRRAARVVIATALLLTVPLVAMQSSGEVNWNWFDFAFAGTLLLGTGLTYVMST